ncbi:MAG: alpha/beta hydrolase [Gemmatimonadaceae bacterium]
MKARRLIAALAAAAAVGGLPAACSRGAVRGAFGIHPAQAPADTSFDTVFVVSNRRRTARGFTRNVTDSLWHGQYVVRITTGPGKLPELAKLGVRRVDSVALDEATWRNRLRAAAARDSSAEGAVLIYVHGYASSPAAATNQGVQVKARGDHQGPLVLFLWPAHDMKRTFRSPISTYHQDVAAAAQSGVPFARALQELLAVAPNAVLLAHSMGTRVALAGTVTDTANRAMLTAHPLRAFGIFSPDVGADRFRSEFAPYLPDLALRVALYGSASDYLLGASALVNRERRASGITRRGNPLIGIELVDDTRGARADPALFAFLSARHAVRWASAALADFFDVVVAGAPPSCRVAAGAADSVGVGRWRLRPGAKPIRELLADCLH